ncbi:acetolactate synthase large subunit [Microgenomates bacterium UTCPR1]|nr:acetolactate synthase large subunit [Patescibacteria group bacterium]OQY66046.1 MAG: acetolactate synthase large subunit [Microgenomates bacterium UTCPR1]
MNAAELMVKSLENEGVQYVFGVPGEENLALLQALSHSTIKFIVTRHEQTAGFMAATVGRLTGSPGVCLTTLGPGATNAITSSAFGLLGGMPVVFITGQKPIKKNKQGHFQIIDTVELFKPVTKFSKQIVNANSVAASVREAFRLAREERPGSVHLELPEDVADEETNGSPFPVTQVRRPVAEDKALNLAVKMIEKAKFPLIIIGAGGNRKRTSKSLTEFINKTRIPFIPTQIGKGVVDERNPYYLGTAALSDNDYVHCALNKADLVINVGHDIIEKPPFLMKRSDSRKVIHINFFSAAMDNIYFPQLEVVGDIATTIEELNSKIKIQPHWDFSYFMKLRNYLKNNLKSIVKDGRYPYTPQQVVKTVRGVMKDDDIVALDNGMFKIWFARSYETRCPNSLLLDNALATMGAGLSSAMTAKIIFPQKKVLCVSGDGGFMMNSQDLETAKRLGLDLVILILEDNGYGMIKWKQKAAGLDDFGLDFNNPDFEKYAKAYGVKGYKISRSGQLEKLLKKVINQKGIHLISVPIDYQDNQKILVDELKKKTCLL